MQASKQRIRRRTSVVSCSLWTMSLPLLLCSCSGRETPPARPALAATLDSAGESTAFAPGHRNGEDSASLAWEECSADATAIFERLTAAQVGDRKHADAGKDIAALTASCDAGDLAVCNGLGIVYGEGHGVETNVPKAVESFRRACDGGLAMGCFNLGLLYHSGTGVSRDQSEAARWFEKACELGNVIACQSRGFAYSSGRGVPKDFGKAAPFFEKACAGGWAPGCTNLAGLYELGAGVDKDPEKARAYYTKACHLGSAEGCKAAKR